MPLSSTNNNEVKINNRYVLNNRYILNLILFYLISLLGVFSIFFLSSYVDTTASQSSQERLDEMSRRESSLIERRLESYTNIVYSLAGIFTIKDVSAEDWENYISLTQVFSRYPGVNSILYIQNSEKKEIKFVASAGENLVLQNSAILQTPEFTSLLQNSNSTRSLTTMTAETIGFTVADLESNGALSLPIYLTERSNSGQIGSDRTIVDPSGYILLLFNTDKLIERVLGTNSYEVEVSEITAGDSNLIYESSNKINEYSQRIVSRFPVNLAGIDLQFEFAVDKDSLITPSEKLIITLLPYIGIVVVGILLVNLFFDLGRLRKLAFQTTI